MFKLRFRYMALLVIFFLVLLTSLWSNNIYLLIFFSLLTYIVLPINKYWDTSATILLLFSIIYSVMVLVTNQYGSGFVLISYIIAPVGFYRFGRWTMSCFCDDLIRQKLLFLIIACYQGYLFIMTFVDIAMVGVVNVSRVLLEDFGDVDTLGATLYGIMVSVGIGSIAALFANSQNLWLRISYILLALLSVLVVVHLVNRTGIIISIVCILAAFIISTRMNIAKILPSMIILGLLLLVLVNVVDRSEDIVEAYQQRELSSTSNLKQLGGRYAIWEDALRKLVSHPLGWEKVHYAHNLWLDIARVGGWISLFLFLFLTFIWLRNCFCLVRKKITPFTLIIISINVSMFLSSFVEPVIDASVLFFSLFMMIWGWTSNLSNEIVE